MTATHMGSTLVANHRRRAPARDVLDALDQLGPSTADAIATLLDDSTRDVLATLNELRGTIVHRLIESDTRETLPAIWSLA